MKLLLCLLLSVVSLNSVVPVSYDTFLPPAVGSSYTDSAFGTVITRVSSAMTTIDASRGGFLQSISTEYSTISPFNCDNTYLILQHFGYYGLYSGDGKYIKDIPFVVNTSSEPKWSTTDPNRLFFINGNRLMSIDMDTYQINNIHTFSEYSNITGRGESDISVDGKHFVFLGNSKVIFTYNIETNTKSSELDISGYNMDNLYITEDNSVVVGWIANGTSRFTGIELFSSDMKFKRQLVPALGHMSLIRDYMIWTNSNDPHPIQCQNGIVKVRLSDSRQTCLLELDWNLAVHISAPTFGDFVYVETYAPSDPFPQSSKWAPYTNEILQVKLDGSETRRLLHHRSRPHDSYVYQPKVSVSRDGAKMVFTSNFNLQNILGYPKLYSDVYMVNLISKPVMPTTTKLPRERVIDQILNRNLPHRK
jgi:hypothetical protein